MRDSKQKYFAALIDPYIARGSVDPQLTLTAKEVLPRLCDSPHMVDTWEWLWDILHDNSRPWTGDTWVTPRQDGSTPEGRFFTFVDHVVMDVDWGYSEEEFRGEQRGRLLEEIATGRTAIETLRSLSFLDASETDCLRQIEGRLIENENAIREYPSAAPHVTFMSHATQGMRRMFGSPHYEHVAAMTNALFEAEVSADAARKAETRDPVKRIYDLHYEGAGIEETIHTAWLWVVRRG
jgi:hypothetical protein